MMMVIYLLLHDIEPYPTHRGNFSCPERERGIMKNVLNSYRMSIWGGGGLLISSMGGIDIFLNNPFCGNIRKNYCQGINYHVFLTY